MTGQGKKKKIRTIFLRRIYNTCRSKPYDHSNMKNRVGCTWDYKAVKFLHYIWNAITLIEADYDAFKGTYYNPWGNCDKSNTDI